MPERPTYERDDAVRVTRTHLSDGRDLIYFDDAGSALPPQRRPDARAHEDRPPTATMRYDPLTGDWISVATARQGRVHLPPAELDPLAPQTPANPSEIPDLYDVAVFENRSPSFGPDLLSQPAAAPVDGGGETSAPAGGRCEVVCFSPSSTGSLGTLGSARMRTIVEAWTHRTAELQALPGIAQVFPFENRGEAIGVTLHHPHGQVYAYPYVTPRTRSVLAQIARHGDGLFADLLEREANGPRVVLAGEYWTAFVPFAARWPIEIHLMPHRHVPRLTDTTLAERAELATLLPTLLGGVDGLYDTPTPYILGWHQAPAGADEVRLTMTITSPRRGPDKLKFLAGSEAAMGAWVSDVAPEDTARRLAAAIGAGGAR